MQEAQRDLPPGEFIISSIINHRQSEIHPGEIEFQVKFLGLDSPLWQGARFLTGATFFKLTVNSQDLRFKHEKAKARRNLAKLIRYLLPVPCSSLGLSALHLSVDFKLWKGGGRCRRFSLRPRLPPPLVGLPHTHTYVSSFHRPPTPSSLCPRAYVLSRC